MLAEGVGLFASATLPRRTRLWLRCTIRCHLGVPAAYRSSSRLGRNGKRKCCNSNDRRVSRFRLAPLLLGLHTRQRTRRRTLPHQWPMLGRMVALILMPLMPEGHTLHQRQPHLTRIRILTLRLLLERTPQFVEVVTWLPPMFLL